MSPLTAAFRRKRRSGFTLIEIMIVVLIIGILLAIAVPNFVRARETSRAKACVANLKRIDSAKEQYAMDNKLTSAYSVQAPDLYPNYVKSDPVCPSGGNYLEGNIGSPPTCTIGAQSGYNDHVLP